jgi:hypothetical protein
MGALLEGGRDVVELIKARCESFDTRFSAQGDAIRVVTEAAPAQSAKAA